MSQAFESAARPSVKSTYKNLSEVLSAFWNGTALAGNRAIGTLIDVLHGSPRLTQWVRTADGYRIWTADESASITVSAESIYTTKGSRREDLQDGLPAQSLFNTIQTAQQIVKTSGPTEPDEAYFKEDKGFSDGAALDAALEETHAAPLGEDDAELIEDLTAEDALDEDQRSEDGPTPVVTVSKKFIDDISEHEGDLATHGYVESELAKITKEAEALKAEIVGYTAKANRKNAATDGVECPYCGNLNKDAYKGTCPQCPKKSALKQPPKPWPAPPAPPAGRDSGSEAWLMARLKSIQGRVLTILDASPIADKAQREAVKTLVNKEFRREMSRVSDGGWRANDPRYEE